MLFWNLFFQALVIVYAVIFIGLGLSWWARKSSGDLELENEGEV